ncbi:MAG: insulinase family protein [Clostridia bacterium]|nr:insulinase family protein [Clostridia bacterium]
MALDVKEYEITPGVRMSCFRTADFKSQYFTVTFAVPLDEKTASGYSLLTNLFSLTTAKYPTMQEFSAAKDELYALVLDSYVHTRREILLVTLELGAVADSFAFDGEKVLERSLELLSGAIFAPNADENGFKAELVESEKQALTEEITSIIENKPAFARKRAVETLFAGEPFATDPAGSVERVNALDGKQLYDIYYKNCVENAPVFICYSGEADPEYLLACVKKYFPFSPRPGEIPKTLPHVPKPLYRVNEHIKTEECSLVMGFSCGDTSEPVSFASALLFDDIFAGGGASRLFTNLREKEGLCYYCAGRAFLTKNSYFISCGTAFGREKEAEAAVLRELANIAREGVTESELENARRNIISGNEAISSVPFGPMTYMLYGMLSEDPSLDAVAHPEIIEAAGREDVRRFAQTVVPELIYTLSEESD